jgi:hypothetical protein
MTTSTEELRARVRQLNFPTEDAAGPDGHRVVSNPGGSLSARVQRPRPSLGLGPLAPGSPVARRPTPHSLNLGVSSRHVMQCDGSNGSSVSNANNNLKDNSMSPYVVSGQGLI